MLHHKCTDCLSFGKFKINHINVILSVFLQINLVYVRLFTETCKQTESSYKRYHIYPDSTWNLKSVTTLIDTISLLSICKSLGNRIICKFRAPFILNQLFCKSRSQGIVFITNSCKNEGFAPLINAQMNKNEYAQKIKRITFILFVTSIHQFTNHDFFFFFKYLFTFCFFWI